MLKKSVGLLAALAFLGFALPTQADAQATLYISGGGSFPTSDFGDGYSTGWMAAGGVLFDVGPAGLSVGADLFYGQNNGKDDIPFISDTKTTPYGLMGIVDYAFGTPGNIRPYVFGGLGLLVTRVSIDGGDSDSESEFGYQFGAGVAFPVGASSSLYAEGRYLGSDLVKYFAALAGFAFGL